MRLALELIASVCVVGALAGAAEPGPADVGSYGIGMNIGRNIKEDGLELNLDAFLDGVRDALAGKESKYTPEQLRAAFTALQQAAQGKRQERGQAAGGKNQREGAAFLAANKAKEGIKVTASGLQYQVLTAGSGASPKAADTVRVHYEGTLIDGTVFDSSIKRNEPAEFPVNGVIPGWTEALQLMKVGDRWRIFLPSDLAYGARGAGEKIGPHSVLIFDVELLNVKPAGN